MKPKALRDRLFRKDKPNVRPIEIMDEQGNWSRDMGVLWAAYRTGSFDMERGLSQEEFTEQFADVFSAYHLGWMVEDHNRHYRDGYGPVLMLTGVSNGWELEPHMQTFRWATTKNVLRGIVAFLQMMRYTRDVGIVIVHALNPDKRFFRKVSQYGVLHYAGRIPDGDVRGDRNIFYVRGRKEKP